MEQLLNTIFRDANNLFLEQEIDNILNNVNERNLCGRLVIYLNDKVRENNLNGYFVDPEYNRKQDGQVKTILDDEFNIININCDIIVHSRGNNIPADNLIAIEMKKSNRPEEEKISDKKRLRALTKESYDDIWSNDGVTLPKHVCGYVVGFYIELNIKTRQCLTEVYKKGNKIDEWTQAF